MIERNFFSKTVYLLEILKSNKSVMLTLKATQTPHGKLQTCTISMSTPYDRVHLHVTLIVTPLTVGRAIQLSWHSARSVKILLPYAPKSVSTG